MMRIILVNDLSPYESNRTGGAGTSMRLMADGLATAGHDVTFVTYRPKEASERRLLHRWETHCTEDGVRIVTIIPTRHPAWFTIPGSKRLRRWLLGWQFRRILIRIAALRIADVAYVYYDTWLPIQVKRGRGGRPLPRIILRMAGFAWERQVASSQQKRREWNAVFSAVDSLNFLSQHQYRRSLDRAADLDVNIAVAHQFIADVGLAPVVSDRPQRTGMTLNGICIQRFSRQQKRQDLLVEAMAMIDVDVPLRLTFVGSGPTRTNLESIVGDLGLENRVTFLDEMNQADLWSLLSSMDMLCHPSDYEGVSKSIAEAMLLGVPVIVSSEPTVVDEIVHGSNGFVAENTPEAWAAALVAIAEMPRSLRDAVGEAGRRQAASRFDPVICLDRYCTVFEEMVQSAIN